MKKWFAVVVTVLGLSLTASAIAAEKIMIAEPNWVNARLMAHMLKHVIIDKLGVEADTVPGTNPVIFKGMDRGKGDIDVHPDVWLPNQQGLVDTYVTENKTVALSEGYYTGDTAWCVSSAVAERLQLKTVYDLATPEMAKHFDHTGDDRGEIWIGPSAWAGTNIRRVKMRDYGLDNFFDTTTEEEEIAYATFGDAYRKDKPYLTVCYEPHYVFKLYDLFKLEEPPYDEEKWNVIQPSEDPDWLSKSMAMTADATKKIHVGYSLTLATRAPQVANLLKNVSIDTKTMSEWTHRVVIDKSEPATVVQEWIAANSERIDGWLGL